VPALATQVVVARQVVLTQAEPGAGEADLIGWARRLGLQVGVGSAALTLVLSPLLSRFLQLNGVGGLAWLAAGLVPLGVAGGLQGLFQGRSELGRLALMVLGTGVAKVVGGVVPVALGAGSSGVLAGIAVATVGVAVLGLGLAGRAQPGGSRPGGRAVSSELAHACGGLGALLLLANLDVPLARHVLDPTQAGRYAVGAVVSKAAFWFPQAIALVALPGLADRRGQRRRLREALGLVLGIGAAATIGAAVLGRPVIAVAFGDQYRSVGDQAWRFALQGSALSLVQLLLYGGIAAGTRRIPPLLGLASGVEVGLVLGVGGSTVGSVVNLVASVAVIAAAVSWLATPHGPPERAVAEHEDRRAHATDVLPPPLS
jgi:O-antigen/teichoic acid export membrane protein